MTPVSQTLYALFLFLSLAALLTWSGRRKKQKRLRRGLRSYLTNTNSQCASI